jgi:hypothetical protein
MSNRIRKASALKRLFSLLVIVSLIFSMSPVAMAQDFDFSDDDGGMDFTDGSDDFNFEDEAPAPIDLSKKFVMPDNGKPVNLVFFDPVDETPQKTLDQLTEVTLDLLKDEKYSQYDSVEAIPIQEKLAAMSEDERIDCMSSPECLAAMGKEIGAANIVVGRINTVGRERPSISFDLIEVSTATSKNTMYFETQNRLRKQEQDISGALVRLFNIDTGDLSSLLTQREVEESAPLPLAQLISGIAVGAVALGAIGTGIYFGLQAKDLDDKVKKSIDENAAIKGGTHWGDVASQKKAKDDYDKATDYAMLANILYAGGAVLAVVSVILFLVRSDKDEDIFANELYVSPAVGSEGGGVVAGFTF